MHQIPKSSCKTLIFTAPYWDMAIMSYFVEEKWPKIWQNSHISAPEPKIKKIKALCSLQLWKLIRVKCLHFIDFGLWCWDMAVLLPCGSNFRISTTSTKKIISFMATIGHTSDQLDWIIYICAMSEKNWWPSATFGNMFLRHIFSNFDFCKRFFRFLGLFSQKLKS